MVEEFDLEIETRIGRETLKLKLEGRYGDEIAEKFKREVNTILYQAPIYNFGYDLEWPITVLTSQSKGVLP